MVSDGQYTLHRIRQLTFSLGQLVHLATNEAGQEFLRKLMIDDLACGVSEVVI